MNEKILQADVEIVKWSQTMDLIALLYKSNYLEIFRISFKI